MIAALLFIAWTVIAVAVGLVIGRVIRAADEHAEADL